MDPFLRAWREYVYRIAMTLLVDARKWATAQPRRAALLNFADLLFYAAKLARENRAVRQALQRKYRHIFVDEFQDTDPMQAELLFLLASEGGPSNDWTAARVRPGALFVVGDPKQSIYRFRRADIEVYQLARQRIEQSGGAIVPLTTCFRSGSAICDWANEVFPKLFPNEATAQQPAFERLDPGARDPESAEGAVRLPHDASIARGEVLTAGAAAIAAYIQQEVDAGRRTWGDFLLLTRKKKGRLGAYTQALEAARVPYEVTGSGGLLESEYVQALVSLLFALTHSDDGIAPAAIAGVSSRWWTLGARFAPPRSKEEGYTNMGIMESDGWLPRLKSLYWVGSSKRDLSALPDPVIDLFGFALYLAQTGGKHEQAKPLRGFGSAGVLELVEDWNRSTYRAVYTARFAGAIFVLHVFQKKSKQGAATPKADIDLVRKRLKVAERMAKEFSE